MNRSPFFQKIYSRFTFDPRFTFGKSKVWNENLSSRFLPHCWKIVSSSFHVPYFIRIPISWIMTCDLRSGKWEMGNVKIHFSKPEIWLANRDPSREMWFNFLEKCAPVLRNVDRFSLLEYLISLKRQLSWRGFLQSWPKKFVLGCVISPLRQQAESRTLGHTVLAISVSDFLVSTYRVGQKSLS